MIYETFAGDTIYTTKAAHELKALFEKAYEWERMRHAINGQLVGYKMKKLAIDKEDTTRTTLKLAGESVYLALKLLFMVEYQTVPPPFNVFELLDKVKVLTDEQREFCNKLITRRIKDKAADFVMDEAFNKLIDQALEVKHVEKKKTEEDVAALRKELDDQFLALFK